MADILIGFHQASACVSHSIHWHHPAFASYNAGFHQASACVSHSIVGITPARQASGDAFPSGISLCLTFHGGVSDRPVPDRRVVSIRHQPVSHIPFIGAMDPISTDGKGFHQASACVSHSIASGADTEGS